MAGNEKQEPDVADAAAGSRPVRAAWLLYSLKILTCAARTTPSHP